MIAHERMDTDIAIIGSGGAGLMCALHAARAAPELEIAIVSKGAVGRSGCTRMVQGGFNAVLDPGDSIDRHFMDTLEGGKFLNDQELAWTLVSDAPQIVHELETVVGCFFDRDEEGRIRQKAFAGQAFDRTVHRGDLTGIEIMGRLRDQMFRVRPLELEDVRALDLVLDADGEVAGITTLDVRTGALGVLRARLVVMATGGAATMYRIASPAREKTGDGIAMCLRAGIPVRDMEMLQFHPTGLLAGESRMTGAVLEEGLRGAGAYLRNAAGERFMERYDPERMERSTRDLVARACYMEIREGRGTPDGGVTIDISHLGVEEVERRFAGMVARTRQIGSDLARGAVTVSPTSHYHMGGAIIDPDCQTPIAGLLVAGEDAGGVHGANRLGGNGVADSTVYGARAGDTAARLAPLRQLRDPVPAQVADSLERALHPLLRTAGPTPFGLTRRLKEAMWEGCGVVRDHTGLLDAARRVEEISAELETVSVPGPPEANYAWQEALDLHNQITVARAVLAAALAREESRGAHFRTDFPAADDEHWLRYVVVEQASDGTLRVHDEPVELSRAAPPAQARA